jgi:hypothetical protein
MKIMVMIAAQRNGKFVAHLAAECVGLGEFEVMGVNWRSLTN